MPDETTLPDVTGVVLAGGESARFGDRDKALASLAGRPLLARVAEAVREATGRQPVVAVRSAERRARYGTVLPSDAEFALDAESFEGPLAGVVGGLAAVETPWSFVCGCDMPLLSPAAIRWLAGYRDRSADAVAVRHPDGETEPVHALYRPDAVEAVRSQLPRSGGVRRLLAELDRTRTAPARDAPPDASLVASLTNVNTVAELDGIRRGREDVTPGRTIANPW